MAPEPSNEIAALHRDAFYLDAAVPLVNARLLPRYLRYNPAFVVAFARQYLRERRQRSRDGSTSRSRRRRSSSRA